MQKKVSKVKTNVESKRKYRWILALFAASSLAITPIIPLASCGTQQTNSSSEDQKKKLSIPATRSIYLGSSSDLNTWIDEENNKPINNQVTDLFTDKILSTVNTNKITLSSVDGQTNQFTIAVKLIDGYTINGKNSWTSTNLTYQFVSTTTAINVPALKNKYAGSGDLSKWIGIENNKELSIKINDLFADKTLNTTNTKNITLAPVDGQTNQFTITVELTAGYTINGKNSWTSGSLNYVDTTLVPTNITNTFNAYTEEVNDIAILVDAITKTLVTIPEGQTYSAITLKTILKDSSVPLADFIVKYFGAQILASVPPNFQSMVTVKKIKVLITDVLSNKTAKSIMFDMVFGGMTESNSTLVTLLTQIFKAIKQTNTLIANSPLPNFIKQPINYVLSFLDGTNPLGDLIPPQLAPYLSFFMTSGNLGTLDFADTLINYASTYAWLNVDELKADDPKLLSTSIENINAQLFPFEQTGTSIYPTSKDLVTIPSSELNPEDQKASVGFDTKHCVLRTEISQSEFINSFIKTFLKGKSQSTVEKITPDLIKTLSIVGIKIDNSNIDKFIQFILNSEDSNNPYIAMNITEDIEGKNPITNNKTTYISLINLNANGGAKNWFGDANYKGGLFGSSLYDTLLGNKELLKNILGITFSFSSKILPTQVSGLFNLTFKNNFIALSQLDQTSSQATTSPTPQEILDGINVLIDKLGLNGQNVYDLINAWIGNIENTQSYKFAETWIINNSSPDKVIYDESNDQYIYRRTYNFGTVDNPNKISNLNLKPLKSLIGSITINDVAKFLHILMNEIPETVKSIGDTKIQSFLSDGIVIPSNLSFVETLSLDAKNITSDSQSSIDVYQTIDISGMNELFDNVFGFNTCGKNPNNKNSMFAGDAKAFIVQLEVVLTHGKSYIFDINTKDLNIRFNPSKTTSSN